MGYIDKKFLDEIPKGYKIFSTIQAVGVNYHTDNIIAFIKGSNQDIDLVPEPTNKYDKNAIMVVGTVDIKSFIFFKTRKSILLGYIDKDDTKELLKDSAYKNYKIRKRYAGASERGGIVEFQLLIKKPTAV